MEKILNFMKNVQMGRHIVLFYESLEFKHKVLFSFLKEYLQREMTVLYISHKEPAMQVLKEMQSFGIDVKRYIRAGLFELWEIAPDLQIFETQSSIHNASFDEPAETELLRAYFEGKCQRHMVVIVDDPLQNMSPKTVVELERSHNKRIEHTPTSLISTYSIKDVSREGRLFIDLINIHRHIIIQTQGTIINL